MLNALLAVGLLAHAQSLVLFSDWSREGDCEDYLAKLPKGLEHKSIQVPLDWDRPLEEQIRVAYYIKKGTNPEATPIVFMNGGPSMNSFYAIEDFQKVPEVAAFFDRNTVIFIDQRGTGCSSLYKDPFNLGSTELKSQVMESYAHYTSHSIVRDAEAIRKNLIGNKPWKIFGQSYGATIVYRYLMNAPEGVAAAFAHGGGIENDPIKEKATLAMATVKGARDYFERYPEDRAKITKLLELVPKDYCIRNSDDEATSEVVCGRDLVLSFTQNFGFRLSYEGAHKLLTEMDMSSPKALIESEAWKEHLNQTLFSFHKIDALAFSVIDALEFWGIFNSRLFLQPRETCFNTQSKVLELFGFDLRDWIFFSDCDPDPVNQALANSMVKEIAMIHDKHADPVTIESLVDAVQHNPHIPLRIYMGRYDHIIQMEHFASITKELALDVNLKVFIHTGHEGYSTEPLIWEEIESLPLATE